MFRNLFEDNDFSAPIPLHARVHPPLPCFLLLPLCPSLLVA